MRVGVFCGSKTGSNPAFANATELVGRYLAGIGYSVVYGGGKVGLMGVLANAALASGGEVIGVMPRHLADRELAHQGLSFLHLVDTLHERKQHIAAQCDWFLALPGATGTLEEIMEQWAWAQLGIHEKPCAFLNVRGFFDPFLGMTKAMVAEGFLDERYGEMLIVEESIVNIVERVRHYAAPRQKWL